MQTISPSVDSAWQKLRNHEINYEEALSLLVDEQGTVNREQLDKEVTHRFFRHFPDRNRLPPIIPLLLWRGCYYLGSPVTIPAKTLQEISDRTLTEIKVIPITTRSYRVWYHTQNLDPNRITAAPLVNPLTGELEKEDITEITEAYLAKAVDQIGKIKTLIRKIRSWYSGAIPMPLSTTHNLTQSC
jgi:hypothetical protein